jgi:hypothetical protein
VAVPISTSIAVSTGGAGNTAQFNAQGTFLKGGAKTPTFHDITSGATWFHLNNNTSDAGNGLYLGVTQGCDCIAASAGGFTSQTLSLSVGGASGCGPCSQFVRQKGQQTN